MLEVIKRYSEEKYYQKQDFMKEFDAATAHVLWDETQRYRHLFRYDLPYINPSCYIVLCRKVTFALLHCERTMQYFCEHQKDGNYKLHSELWERIAFDFVSMGKHALSQWIHKACHMLCIKQVSECEALLTSKEPILLRLFLCFQQNSEQGIAMAQLLLLKENKVAMTRILHTQIPMSNVYESDITYEFLNFMEHIELKINQGMVSLEHTCDNIPVELDVKELSQRYPQLSVAQITFYKKHNLSQHYYTISHFMEFANVCYETARCAMDKLVELHWYQKRKLGKKFVYYIYES